MGDQGIAMHDGNDSVKSREVKLVLNYAGIVGNNFAKFLVFQEIINVKIDAYSRVFIRL